MTNIEKGTRFTRLCFIKELEVRDRSGCVICLCSCDCGNEVTVRRSSLLRGEVKSCGCLLKESNITHGKSNHPLYNRWKAMIDRCHNINSSKYKNYGARGITVCRRWREHIDNFLKDMYPSYKNGLELDRIDTNKGYSKENCRWVTHKQNLHNRMGNSLVGGTSIYKGVSYIGKGKYRVRIQNKEIGIFTKESDAALAYNKEAMKLYGEHAYLNKIED